MVSARRAAYHAARTISIAQQNLSCESGRLQCTVIDIQHAHTP